MDNNQLHDDLIDLGTASIETYGTPIGVDDEQGHLPAAGLSRD
jgi:hypothetical protein